MLTIREECPVTTAPVGRMVQREAPSTRELVRAFGKVGCLGFGGPAGQAALLQRVVVDERGWLDARSYADGLSLCTVLPGPEAMQLATWIGWRVAGARGATIAAALFVLPGAACVWVAAATWKLWSGGAVGASVVEGLRCAVVCLLCASVIQLAQRLHLRGRGLAVAVVAAVLALPPISTVPLALLFGALLGIVIMRGSPSEVLAVPRSASAPGPAETVEAAKATPAANATAATKTTQATATTAALRPSGSSRPSAPPSAPSSAPDRPAAPTLSEGELRDPDSHGALAPRRDVEGVGVLALEEREGGETASVLLARRPRKSGLLLLATAWIAPLIMLAAWQGGRVAELTRVLLELALFGFGGAYTMVAWFGDAAVERAWVAPSMVAEALGVAEATPGPLVLALQFLSHHALANEPGATSPFLAGSMGALLAAWSIFLPSALWVLAAAGPYERLRSAPLLAPLFAGVRSASLGVLFALGLELAVATLWQGASAARFVDIGSLATCLALGAWLVWQRASAPVLLVAGVALRLLLAKFAGV
jgi:chromate transport protein ChrA